MLRAKTIYDFAPVMVEGRTNVGAIRYSLLPSSFAAVRKAEPAMSLYKHVERYEDDKMSLYNIVSGHNANAGACLLMLGFTNHNQLPRFRDAWLTDDGETIVVLTRTGGNNRADYADENATLTQRPYYIRDMDDPDDSTYARWYFNTPLEFVSDAKIIARGMVLASNGQDAQGPGAMAKFFTERAFANSDEAEAKKKRVEALPEFSAAWEAYQRVIATVKVQLQSPTT